MRFHRFSAILPVTLGACGVLAHQILLPPPLAAATITVNGQTGDPPGTSCDLVEAMLNAMNATTTPTVLQVRPGPTPSSSPWT
jgi:hypothetical protein